MHGLIEEDHTLAKKSDRREPNCVGRQRAFFGPQQVISADAMAADSLLAAHLDLDVLSASGDDDKMAWYGNGRV